ncbi:epidermis-specific secreted glycoprotein EP1-like [Vicia villosa]|uniref:epidermis-specific secreted glycoprotein EP1-like n=1 Tax=Vicia villosa TaxID=3911 RepID=UPI00273BBDCF|nr:epidermis-specific secreted glycoprotein EP1-like [Vicia villosa]
MSLPLLTLLFLSFSTFLAQAIVPKNETFKFVNSGELGPFIVEYGADYRMISIFNAPFQVGFYNTTPNAYTLALRIGLQRSEQLFRWVWEANRGNPVDENATFSLNTNGNLELANSNGRIVWQTNTSNKGVVAFRLLPNGNMVLIDAKGNFIWQSFDHPTDTLLVDQYLRPNGPSKLVSRLSEKENLDGPYSLVLEPKDLALYYKSKNSPKPILYWSSSQQGPIENVTLTSDSESFEIRFDTFLGRPVSNSTITYLRLGIDGNIKFNTYFLDVRSGVWQVTYTLFDRDFDESECQLPERCGKFGLCEDNQCVGCPLENGIFGWSNKCSPKPLGGCKPSEFHYYKIEGVEHYMSKYTIGDRVSEDGCGSKCSKDCKCVGYFYHKDNSRCWIAYDLQTLTRVANATHVGYVKVPNKLERMF